MSGNPALQLLRPARLLPSHVVYLAMAQNILILVEALALIPTFAMWIRFLNGLVTATPGVVSKPPLVWVIGVTIYLLDFLHRVGPSVIYTHLHDTFVLLFNLKLLDIPRPRTSATYKCLRIALLGAESSLVLYGVASTPPFSTTCIAIPSLTIYAINLTISLLSCTEAIAAWMYQYDSAVDRGAFSFQVSRWWEIEQSTYLGRGREFGLISPGDDRPSAPVYAPLQTLLVGESKNTPAARQAEKNLTPLFVRCNCCLQSGPITVLENCRSANSASTFFGIMYGAEKAYAEYSERRRKLFDVSPSCISGRFRVDDNSLLTKTHRLCHVCDLLVFRFSYDHKPTTLSILKIPFSGWSSARNFTVYEHLANPQLLAASADDCHLCAMMWNELSTEQQSQLLEYDQSIERAGFSSPEQHEKRSIRVAFNADTHALICHFGGFKLPRRWLRPSRGHDRHLTMRRLRGAEVRGPMIIGWNHPGSLYPPMITSTASQLAIDILKRWLQCIRPSADPGWLPTRLIDVSNFCSGFVNVRHREDVTEPHRRYIALSHCWGPTDFRTYNTSTRTRFESRIPIADMAKTFVDVFWLAKQLGISYVWIDALCILQNDVDDWQRESATMFQIYKSATLTVAATASWSASEGLFRNSSTLPEIPCLLYSSGGNAEGDNHCAFAVDGEGLGDKSKFMKEIEDSRWFSRAWTLQERQLSSRIAFFTETTIVLEDKDIVERWSTLPRVRSASLANPWMLDRWMDDIEGASHERREASEVFQEKTDLAWQFTRTYDCFSVWWAWVTEYTHRRLTKPADRAIAILGLAQYLSALESIRHLRLRYIAGLWDRNMELGLLWFVQFGADTRPSQPRAPSWSWISINGGILNHSILARPPVTVSVTIEHIKEIRSRIPASSGEAEHSSLRPTVEFGSFIQLRGKLNRLTWSAEPHKPAHFYSAHTPMNLNQHPGLLSNATLGSGALPSATTERVGPCCYPLRLRNNDTAPAVGWFIPDTSDLDALPEILHCLCFAIVPDAAKPKQYPFTPWVIRGLALRPFGNENSVSTTESEIPSFERVGFFELEWQCKGIYLPFEAYFLQSLAHYPRRVAPDIDPHGVFADCEMRSLRLY